MCRVTAAIERPARKHEPTLAECWRKRTETTYVRTRRTAIVVTWKTEWLARTVIAAKYRNERRRTRFVRRINGDFSFLKTRGYGMDT